MKTMYKYQWWMKWIYPSLIWKINTTSKEIYLTFDDGPHPEITPWVLDQLKAYDAQATFFCVGQNVERYPDVFERIKEEGHLTGNHTYDHSNGWKTKNHHYLASIKRCDNLFGAFHFRPPYGKIKRSQIKHISKRHQIVMWTVLSGDFDRSLTGKQVSFNTIQHTKEGSIVVFHDSEKAFERLKVALPEVLNHFTNIGYTFLTLPLTNRFQSKFTPIT